MTDTSAGADLVLAERRGPVLVLTLNRPGKLNAWNNELEDRYFDLLEDADNDPEVRVIVITGAGRGFCSGADLSNLKQVSDVTAENLVRARPRDFLGGFGILNSWSHEKGDCRNMIESKLCSLIGIKYPIIQAGMGPFGTNKLCIAAANAGVLGLISSSGIAVKDTLPGIYEYFVKTGGATIEDDNKTVLRKIFRQTLDATREKRGIFGVNVMVSAESMDYAKLIIDTAIEVREEDPEMKERFRVIVTSAGDPLLCTEKIKKAGFKWIHVMPSVKAALRCRKAGVDAVIASGHEGGFHTSWEPVHSMILLPAVVDALDGSGIVVVGAGGFCDGRTLAAALALGAAGVQMGTRFLATQESDFHPMWKEGVVKAGDRGTLVARGFVGPARWLKTPRSLQHQENTLKMSPGVFLGRPDDLDTVSPALIESEIESLNAVYAGDEAKALLAAGECAQRINDITAVEELVQSIMKEAEATLSFIGTSFLQKEA